MSPIISKIVKQTICVFLTGIVIKLMDDYIDQDIDRLSGQNNIFNLEEDRIMPYILLTFAVACSFDLKTAITLFFASYSLGMMESFDAKMPTLLYSYQESLLVIALGALLLGLANMLSSIFIIACIHLLDDYVDYNKDKSYKKNWVFILGKVEVIILSLIFLVLAIYIDLHKSILVLILSYPVVYIINLLYTKLLQRRNDYYV